LVDSIIQWKEYARLIDPTPILASVDLNALWTYLLEGNYLGFIVACYTILIGEGFYAYVMLVGFGIVYARTRNLGLIAIMWTVLGSFFILLAPLASPIVVMLWIFGVVGTLFSLYTGRK
jgi:hypothetical protein